MMAKRLPLNILSNMRAKARASCWRGPWLHSSLAGCNLQCRVYHKKDDEILESPPSDGKTKSTSTEKQKPPLRVLSSSSTSQAHLGVQNGQTTFLNYSRNMSSNGTSQSSSAETTSSSKQKPTSRKLLKTSKDIIGNALQKPAGPLYGEGLLDDEFTESDDTTTTLIKPGPSDFFIPEVALHESDGSNRSRVLVLCTGGTLTMAPDPSQNGALAPIEGALTTYMKEMNELSNENMPEVIVHEYTPFFDSSDMGPNEWAVLANDIKENYYHFDGFVVAMGTDTMAYAATALSFMLENLGKPVIFTGSQIPLSQPYNDARRNLIMSLIFASRDTIPEVCIFFHDRLLRACRATKVNTHRLDAFDSPNLDALATIGLTINENEHLSLPRARGALRIHTRMDTRLLTLRLVPGFDDEVISHLIATSTESDALKVLVLQLYGTGNAPSVKKSFVQMIGDAVDKGVMVVANTQCHTGSVLLGHYATGVALKEAGVVSANDMTIEAISCKAAYLIGRGDLTIKEVSQLMSVSLRGELTPSEALSPPPLPSPYQRASRKGKKYY